MRHTVRIALFAALLSLTASLTPAFAENALTTRQFQLDTARSLTPNTPAASRQTVTCWQVAQGSWNGQSLGGLSLVLVQPLSLEGRPTPSATVYVSDVATPAQREALLSALAAANPLPFANHASNDWQIQPAAITIEQPDGSTLILHLGLVA